MKNKFSYYPNDVIEMIEELDPNVLTEEEIEAISKIYGKWETGDCLNWCTNIDLQYVLKIYEKYIGLEE